MVVDPWPNNASGGYSRTGPLLVAQDLPCPRLKYEHKSTHLSDRDLRPSTVSGTETSWGGGQTFIEVADRLDAKSIYLL